MSKSKSKRDQKAGVQAWFVYRKTDSTSLYSRVYSAIEGNVSTQKAITFRDLIKTTLDLFKMNFSWMSSSTRIENISLDDHEVRFLYGKYIMLVIMIRNGNNVKNLYQLHSKMVSYIEKEAYARLSSQLDEPELLRDIWIKCEELFRPYIIHIF